MDQQLKNQFFLFFFILLTLFLPACGSQQPARLTSSRAPTDPALFTYKRILAAEQLLEQGAPDQALAALKKIWRPKQLPKAYQQKFYRIRAKAYLRNGHLFEAAQDSVQNLQPAFTWEILSQANLKSLQTFKHKATTNKSLQGWIELAYLAKLHDPDSAHFFYAFNQWQQRFPQHPGRTTLRHALNKSFHTPVYAPQKIGLLLPSRGAYHKSGEIIRDGFLASYYAINRNRAPKHTVRIYNTGDGTRVLSAYEQAVADKMNFVVGPLTKREVNAIASIRRLNVPVLALNTIYNTRRLPNNLFLFGLPPENEVEAITKKARQANHRSALLIVPENDWGHRIASAFKDHWRTLGGTLLGTEFFGTSKNHSRKMRTLLEISSSEARAEKIQKLLGKKMIFKPRRRQDPDVIFMATPPEMARQLKPLLNYYYAADLPVYATSHIFSAQINATKDQDLNNVIFCDMPWVLEHTDRIKNARLKLSQLWPKSFDRSPRLFALGMDAYRLSHSLSRLSHFPNTVTKGMSGQLTLSGKHYIMRKPTFAKMKNGTPKLIP